MSENLTILNNKSPKRQEKDVNNIKWKKINKRRVFQEHLRTQIQNSKI